MKKTIALFSIVLGTAAGVKAQALTRAPRPSGYYPGNGNDFFSTCT
jgi:hypothetical protein